MKLKISLCIIVIILLLVTLAGCSTNNRTDSAKLSVTFADLKDTDFTIGTPEADAVAPDLKELFPNATIEYYNDIIMGLQAVESGKIDAFASGKYFIERDMADSGTTKIVILDETVKTFKCALGLSNYTEIENYEDRVNECIAQLKADGTIDDMKQRWFVDGNDEMPEIPQAENPEYTLHIATFGASRPYSFYKDNVLTGFDVELAYRVAAYLNCAVEIDAADYTSLLMGLSTGKYDMISANLYVSEEREDSVIFSEPYSENDICLCISADSISGGESGDSINSLADFYGIDAVIASPSDYDLKERFYEICPGASLEYYDDILMAIDAVKNGKIDGFACGDNYLYAALESENTSGVKIIEEPVTTYYIGLGLSECTEIDDYVSRVNECIASLKEDGTLEDMKRRWFEDENYDMPEIVLPENPEYTLHVVTYGLSKPYSFVKDNELTGFDVELAYRVAAYLNCDIDMERAEYPSMLMGLSSGKYDMISANLYISENRSENIQYSDSFDEINIKMLVKDSSSVSKFTTFLNAFKEGFEHTFVDEGRWKMIVSGLCITLLITVLGFILANILGGVFCAFSMSRFKVLRVLEDIYTRIMQGTPIVVTLMILFYIIFGKSSISGVWIAVLGFGLTSGSSLARQFKGAIISVPTSQIEAGLALGFTKVQTFVGIISPQAARSLLPGYFSEIIGLLKGTSIVGYVAVVDLTKVSDIIRSSTYDAFFPLLSVAVIYFLISFLLLSLLKLIQKKLEPKRVQTQEGTEVTAQ